MFGSVSRYIALSVRQRRIECGVCSAKRDGSLKDWSVSMFPTFVILEESGIL